MALNNYLFTSESVTEGHPDKMCDNISDAVLDAHLAIDPNARVACETAVKTRFVVLAGEITSSAIVDYPAIVRDTVRDIGFTDSSMGFDAKTCAIMVAVHHDEWIWRRRTAAKQQALLKWLKRTCVFECGRTVLRYAFPPLRIAMRN